MEKDPLLKFKIAMNLIPGIGCIMAKRIIAHTGGPDVIFSEKKKNLLTIPGIGKYLASKIDTSGVLERAEKEIEFIERNKIMALFYLDNEFPERLRHCEDGPLLIFCKGKTNFNRKKVLSVVGTRSSSNRGNEFCENLIRELGNKSHDVLIISGLAYGIDITSHKSALKNNMDTVSVLAHGLDTIYPNLHKNIARKICNNGALITEFLSNTELERPNFVKRNRIIAGLSDATVVIESRTKGGAMITADIANSYNRDVFAVPGRINDKTSSGCNLLIKNNQASLIEKAEDIEKYLQWDISENKSRFTQMQLFPDLIRDEQTIVNMLNSGPKSIDQICYQSKINVSKVSVYLLNLEFAGHIKSLPGKIYSLAGTF